MSMNRDRSGGGTRVFALVFFAFALAGSVRSEESFNVWRVGHGPFACHAAQVVGRYGYAGGGIIAGPRLFLGWLFTLDLSNPTSPGLLARFELPYPVERIHVKGGLAYIVDGYALRIIDVTNPSSPSVRGSYPGRWNALGVFAAGALAYIADSQAGLTIVDVTNPASPTLRGTYDTPGEALNVFVSDSMAFVADNSSLQIIDVRSPSLPVYRGAYDSRGGSLRNVLVSNGVAYVTITFGPWSPICTFECVDITNPAAPRLLAWYGTTGSAGDVFVSGRYAYVVLDGFLRIFDISNPSSPTLRGFYSDGLGGWDTVFASGDLVYAGNPDGLDILQFTGRPAAASRWRMYR